MGYTCGGMYSYQNKALYIQNAKIVKGFEWGSPKDRSRMFWIELMKRIKNQSLMLADCPNDADNAW